jgi:hypothetical protein
VQLPEQTATAPSGNLMKMAFRAETLRRSGPRVLIIGGVLVAALGVGLASTRFSWRYIAFAAAAPIVLVTLLRLEFAPVAILLTAAFVPFSISTGTQSPVVASLLAAAGLAAFWVFRRLAVSKELRLWPSAVNKPLIGFMIVTVVALIWSVVFRDAAVVTWSTFYLVQLASTVVMLTLPATFLLVADLVADVRVLKALAVVIILAGLVGLLRYLAPIGIPVNTAGLFSMWLVSLGLGMAIINTRLNWMARGFVAALAASSLYIGLGRNVTWVTGWLPSVVALCVLSWMRSKKLFLAVLAAAVLLIMVNPAYLDSVMQAEMTESGYSRLAAWETNWTVTGKHLLFGTGPGGYAAYYMTYFPGNAMATHSNYVDILAQTGIVGLLFCLWFFASLLRLGYQVCRRLRGRNDFTEALANAAFAGTVACVVAMGFGDWVFPFAYTQTIAGFDHAVYSWILMGTVVVLDRLTFDVALQGEYA